MSGVFNAIGKVAGIVATVAPFFGPVGQAVAVVASAVAVAPAAGADLNITRKPMTAINLFVDNAHAYLATDGAAYDLNSGRVFAIGQKATMFPSQSMVIATSGRATPPDVLAALDACHPATPPTQASLLAALPAAVRLMRDRMRERDAEDEAAGRNTVCAYAAFYDRERGAPGAARCFSPDYPGANPADAYTLVPMGGHAMPALSAEQQRAVFPLGYVARPVAEMRELLTLQRHVTYDAMPGGCAVGGPCYFYRIGAAGVEGAEIMRFPEVAGQRLDPARAGAIVPSALDGLLAA